MCMFRVLKFIIEDIKYINQYIWPRYAIERIKSMGF